MIVNAKSPALTILICFLFAACASKENLRQSSNSQIAKKNFPHWIEQPELKNHVTVVSSAMPQKMGGLEGQRRAALLRARAQLAKDVRVFVSKSLHIEKASQHSEAKVTQKLTTRATELQQLDGAKINAEWIDPDSKELFIWYVIATN